MNEAIGGNVCRKKEKKGQKLNNNCAYHNTGGKVCKIIYQYCKSLY